MKLPRIFASHATNRAAVLAIQNAARSVSRRRPARLQAAFAVAVAGLSICAALRFLWWSTAIAPGQYQMGYFEEPAGVASLVLDDVQHTSVEPDVGLDASGAFSLVPGRSIALPLTEGVEYRIRTDDRPWAPFCVFGQRQPIADEATRHGGFRLAQARLLAVADGRLTDVDWTVLRPWRDDQRSLTLVRGQCGAGNETRLIVQAHGGAADLRYGSCSSRIVAVDTMAVLAGPAWTSVEKQNPGWRVESRVRPGSLLVTLVVGALTAATASVAIGATGAAVVSAAIAVTTWISPQSGLAGFAGLLLAGFITAGLRMVAAAWRSRSRLQLALGFLFWAVPISIAVLPFALARLPSSERQAGMPRRCLLLGYSTVRGDSLRQDGNRGPWVEHGGLWDIVEQCGACAGAVDRRARAAASFSWVRDTLCDVQPSAVAGGDVLFFGGSNDDLVSARFRPTQLAQVVRLARYAYSRPDVPAFHRLAESAEADSLAALPAQEATLNEALACVARDRARFRYIHDFFAWDLAEPRSDARQQMLNARAEAVRRAGGEFVDVLHEVADTVGVWWFNDYVHPSQIAHRRIGALMCRELEKR